MWKDNGEGKILRLSVQQEGNERQDETLEMMIKFLRQNVAGQLGYQY